MGGIIYQFRKLVGEQRRYRSLAPTATPARKRRSTSGNEKLYKFVTPVAFTESIMRAGEIFGHYSAALERGDIEAIAGFLHEEFRLEGVGLVGKREFVATMKAQLKAFPDYSENATDVEEVGDDVVQFVTHVTGTQSGTLVLPGLPPIPPTGRVIRLPREPAWVQMLDGKMLVYHVAPVPGGGIKGIVAQLKG